jgi:LPS-assembly protein
MEMLGEDKYRMSEGTFSTCQPGNEDWYIKFGQLDLDYGRSLGVARSAQVLFMGVPIMAAPWMEFSLNNQRKSGFLPPSYGRSGKGGAEVTAPYYWNIAPNRDATIAPRIIAKRGLQLGTEFRYMEPNYRGEARYEVLPDDKAKNRSRYAFSALHTFAAQGFSGGWNINKVSDDDYFRDLSSKINITSQSNLNREAFVSRGGYWLGDGTWGMTGRVQRYQTLQDPLAPIDIPYARLPQLSVSAGKQVIGGADFAASGEYVDFTHPTKTLGKRTSTYPTLSLPILTSGVYVTPKIGYNVTHYELSRNSTGPDNSITRTLPIFSVDSGMTFDRNTSFRGQDVVQTLEPRLYYVNIPYRNQNNIPLFDTGIADFNYSQIFSENSFSGNDRINDANQLTAAVTTRMLQPNGQELMRAIVGQRYYFKNQAVTLNPTDTPRTYTASDWLAGASGRIAPRWTADTTVQYNARENRTERFSLGTRYQPEVQKVMNLGYRYNRDVLHQIDASSQWPLGGGWYGLGRYNFSLQDGKLVEGLAGLEYDGGCWIVRVVGQRFATAVGVATTSLFVQLELNGFSRLGSNPLEALKRNISGYSQLNKASDPNRPLNYYD